VKEAEVKAQKDADDIERMLAEVAVNINKPSSKAAV
jgi:hypothetical protein